MGQALSSEINTTSGDAVTVMSSVASKLSTQYQDWFLSSNSVKILVTGKAEIGKSILVNGVIGKAMTLRSPQDHTDDNGEVKLVQTSSLKFNDIEVTIWESAGLQDGIQNEEECIQQLQAQGCDKADLVLYCVSMKRSYHQFFSESNNAIRKLTDGLGVDIWKKTIFVMTFANQYDQKIDSFKECLEQWKAKLTATVVDAGVKAKIAANIPIVPAGSDREQALPDRNNWLSCLWCTGILRMSVQTQPALLKINLPRIKLPHQVSAKNFNKPLYEQPVVYKQPPITTGKPNIFLALEELINITKVKKVVNKKAETSEHSLCSPRHVYSDLKQGDDFIGTIMAVVPIETDIFSVTAQATGDMSRIALGAGGTDWLIAYYSSGCDHAP